MVNKAHKHLVSILMPAYNCEEFVKQAIDSILSQTYTNFEFLIADDCSKDNTKKIIDTYSDERIKRFHNETNLGYLQASNKLFLECRGVYITFQDADDFSEVSRIEKLVGFLNENEEFALVSSDINRIEKDGKLHSRSFFPNTYDEIKTQFLQYKTIVVGSAMMVRKKILEEFGLYNLYFDRIGYEDFYLFSLILQKHKVFTINEPLYNYRFNPNSVSALQTNPRAIVGHDLIILMYKRRLESEKDYILNEQWNSADVFARFLMIIRNSKQKGIAKKIKFLFKFFTETIFHPVIGVGFFRQFFVTFLKQ